MLKPSFKDEMIKQVNPVKDEQRENIVSIMQTVPFGGDLFDQSWPQWLSGTESGSMKLLRLCLQCPDTTDPVQFLKWFLYIGTVFLLSFSQG